MITIYFILHYWFIESDTVTTLSIGYLICIVTTVMILPFPESPRLLLAQGREQELKAAIDFFAKRNNKSIDWESINLHEQVEMRKNKQEPQAKMKDTQIAPIVNLDLLDSLEKWSLELRNLPPWADGDWLRKTIKRSAGTESQETARSLIEESIV